MSSTLLTVMDIHQLGFSTVNLISEDIAEVIVNQGVEMDQSMVDLFHDFLVSHMKAPFSILLNKINSYSYDFDAQNKLFTIDQINNIAVVCYNSSSVTTMKYITQLPKERDWNSQIFTDRESALNWLTVEQQVATTVVV